MTGALTGSVDIGMVTPGIKVGKPPLGLPLSPLIAPKIVKVVVDNHLHLPDMFEITLHDEDGKVVGDANISIGQGIEISGAKSGDTSPTTLIEGEVTSIEAICVDGVILSVVRGYEKAHRLQRARRTKTFLNQKDSDIARKVAGDAGLSIGTIDTSSTTHEYMVQMDQTDWEFLTWRAREIGFETGVSQGKFFFRKGSDAAAGGGLGGALSAAASAVAGALGLGGALTFPQNLLRFQPRISGANVTPDVEVRVWDPDAAQVVVGNAPTKSNVATITGEDPATLANSFTDGLLALPAIPSLPSIPGLPSINLGSQPSNTAFVVVDRPLASGSAASGAADEMAAGLANHVGSTFAEAEGEALGDPSIMAGQQVDIKGVPKMFVGKWTVTNSRHIFDQQQHGGYLTQFFVSGRQDRSLLALASGASTRERSPRLGGLACGVITNVKDPKSKGKVKFSLPWLSPNYESDWARVAHVFAGGRAGAMFMPEVGDEVLVGFEFGDPRRPYVLGGLVNSNTKFEPLGSAVKADGTVTKRGLATPSGNQLLFTDEVTAPGAPPTASAITLGTGDSSLALAIDQSAGTVTITCKPAPPGSKTPAGTITIDCSGPGKIEIKGGSGGVKVESEGQLELSGQLGVKISSNAMVQVQGQMIQLN